MLINSEILDNLSVQAKSNLRLRQGLDMRTTTKDNSQRLLNAMEPGTVVPIHRHLDTSETMVMVRGKLIERLYDDVGNLINECVMEPCGEYPMIQIEAGQWHSLEVIEAGTIIFEAKDGKYAPLLDQDIMR